MAKILLVEDDTTLCETLRYNLEREGYEIMAVADGPAGLALGRTAHPDLVILDVMLPGLDGLSLCRILRGESAVPIMILTARASEIDRVAGFEMGADDYLVKPFHLGELLARVRVMLRRSKREPERREVLSEGALHVDTGSRRAFLNGTELGLSPKEFDLLACLMRNRGMALSRNLLLERVWGWDFRGDPRTVDVHIHWLREKVEANPAQPCYIQTVRGTGYRFNHAE